MRNYVKDYVLYLENLVNENKQINKKDLDQIIIKINFFQHERLIHLLVTFFFAFITLLFMILGMISYLFLIPFAMLIVFDIFYVIHYFFLENSVQYMYKLYDKLLKFY